MLHPQFYFQMIHFYFSVRIDFTIWAIKICSCFIVWEFWKIRSPTYRAVHIHFCPALRQDTSNLRFTMISVCQLCFKRSFHSIYLPLIRAVHSKRFYISCVSERRIWKQLPQHLCVAWKSNILFPCYTYTFQHICCIIFILFRLNYGSMTNTSGSR